MKSRELWRPSNMLYPCPAVMVSSASADGKPNIMTAAWAGTVCSDPVMVSVSIRRERYSYEIIHSTGEFVINLTTRSLVKAADYCGVRSGRDTDKFEKMHLTPVKGSTVNAPLIDESPVCLECRVKQEIDLGSHVMFVAEVTAVSVDASLISTSGRLELEKADLAAYSHGEYFALGESLGKFGFSVRKRTAGRTGAGPKKRSKSTKTSRRKE